MRNTGETIIDSKLGGAHLRVTLEMDSNGYEMASEMARFTSLREAKWDAPLYARREDVVRLPKSDIWRDRKGRIASAPEDDRGRREYGFIQVTDWYDETLKIAFSVADRLEAYERGDWYYADAHAVLTLNGATIGEAYIGGIESDGDGAYKLTVATDTALEAIAEGQSWIASTLVIAA